MNNKVHFQNKVSKQSMICSEI